MHIVEFRKLITIIYTIVRRQLTFIEQSAPDGFLVALNDKTNV